MTKTNVMRKLTGCARCDGTHENLEYKQFSKYPIEDTDGTIWSHFAICPNTSEPILIKVDQNKLNEDVTENIDLIVSDKTINVTNCAKCNNNHENIKVYNYYICPVKKETVLVTYYDDGNI